MAEPLLDSWQEPRPPVPALQKSPLERPLAALRRFKKLIERSGMKGELRAHEYYEKPCEARTRKEAKRKSTIRKALLGKPPKKERY